MSEFIKKPESKKILVIRVLPSTIEFLTQQGAKSTVGNKILEIAVNNWEEFKKLDKSEV